MKSTYLLSVFFVLTILWSPAQISTFSNTNVSACNSWDSGNNFGVFTKTIAASGLPTGGLSLTGTVLRQINLKLGNSSCTGNLSSYQLRLTNPSGTTYDFSTQLVTTISSIWVDMSFRDNSALELLRNYSSTIQNTYYPHTIGYYKTETTNGFTTFNDGTDPNGNWTFSIKENTSSEISFEKIELIFGPAIQVNDLSASSANNNCSGAACIDGTQVTVGTNNGYSQTDPNYPGNSVNGCSWNGNNNNSAWFEFYATGGTAYITVSGLMNTSGSTSADMQLIVVTAPSSCSAPTAVPTGGCPDDVNINNSSYLSSNGGGVGSGNPYSNGITDNCEFNLSGLSAGQKYYLYIDGNGGASSTFYIEAQSGTIDCNLVLPISFLYFTATEESNGNVKLEWSLEENNREGIFSVQKSTDAVTWKDIGILYNSGASAFNFTDENPEANVEYYRVFFTNEQGDKLSSTIRVIEHLSSENSKIFPVPASDFISVVLPKNSSSAVIFFYTADGRLVHKEIMNQSSSVIDISHLPAGTYLLTIQSDYTVYKKTLPVY